MTARYPSIHRLFNGAIFVLLVALVSGCASTGGNVGVVDSKSRDKPQAIQPTRVEKSKD
mgnify:CR=1